MYTNFSCKPNIHYKQHFPKCGSIIAILLAL